MTIDTADLRSLTVEIVTAYVGNNKVDAGELSALIETTYAALGRTGTPSEPAALAFVPAVSIRKSLASPDHIISMIDGKAYALLKRHLSQNGLTPDAYRARYNLPSDYPMVAPAYSARRSQMAKAIGLGVGGRERGASTATKAAPKARRGSRPVPKLSAADEAAFEAEEQR